MVRCHSQELSFTSSIGTMSALLEMPCRFSKPIVEIHNLTKNFHASSKVFKTPWAVVDKHCFINKVVLEYSHVHLFTYYLRLTLCYIDREVATVILCPTEPKILLTGFLQMKFAAPFPWGWSAHPILTYVQHAKSLFREKDNIFKIACARKSRFYAHHAVWVEGIGPACFFSRPCCPWRLEDWCLSKKCRLGPYVRQCSRG